MKKRSIDKTATRLVALTKLPPLDSLPDDALLDQSVTALFLDVSENSLANQRALGTSRMPFIKVGSGVRYRVGDVRSLIRASLKSAA